MSHCTFAALVTAFFLFLVRVLLRSTWAAAIFCILGIVFFYFPSGRAPLSYLIPVVLMPLLLSGAVHLLLIFRFGLLALVVEQLFFNLLSLFPITTQLSAWYSGIGIAGLVVLLAMALYAFHTSLGGQPLFGRASLQD